MDSLPNRALLAVDLDLYLFNRHLLHVLCVPGTFVCAVVNRMGKVPAFRAFHSVVGEANSNQMNIPTILKNV